jgi:molybdenum cofactor guanylyltransferase
VQIAAVLLTGGASRRMGSDKARLLGPDGQTLAERTATLLGAVAGPAVEVGSGASGLPTVPDDHPGQGPLAAVATGVRALSERGWAGGALVVATDMPRLDAGLVTWLADHSFPGSVVPVVDGERQWLCARYDGPTLAGAGPLVAAGHRRMADLVEGRSYHAAGPDEWALVSSPLAPRDADTPEELADLMADRAETGRRR